MKLYYYLGSLFDLFERIKKRCLNSYSNELYKRQISSLGNGVRFNGTTAILGLSKIKIENNVHIGDGAYIRAEGGLFLGENTHIARNVTIYTHNHNYKGSKLPYDNTRVYKPVKIERNVWIGIGVTILPGTVIEEGCIVGAGSVVYGRIPKFSIVGSSGFNVIGKRDVKHYNELDLNKSYGTIDGK